MHGNMCVIIVAHDAWKYVCYNSWDNIILTGLCICHFDKVVRRERPRKENGNKLMEVKKK